MKKKSIIFAVAILFICCFTTIKGATAGSITLNGTVNTHCGELVFSKFNINGTEVTNFKGQISYDKAVLAIFEVKVDSAFEVYYDYKIDTSTLGVIKFEFKLKDSTVATYMVTGDKIPFSVTYMVIGDKSTTTTIQTKSCSSTLTNIVDEEVEDRSVILNQAEIDAAKAALEANPEAEIEIPDPIYGTKIEQVEKVEAVNYTDSKQVINVSKIISNDSYLKDLSIDGGTLSPSFSKGTNAYKCTIDSKADVKINYTLADPKSTVEIGEEVNNQISITVTAEDGTSNLYVVTIIRQENYSPSGESTTPVNPSTPTTNPSTPTQTTGFAGLDTIYLLQVGLAVVIALLGFTFGGILINKGAHNQ